MGTWWETSSGDAEYEESDAEYAERMNPPCYCADCGQPWRASDIYSGCPECGGAIVDGVLDT